jgi:hypothetical protein
VGVGINVAVRPEEFPPELADSAGTLGSGQAIEPLLARLLSALARWLAAPADEMPRPSRARRAPGADDHVGGRDGAGAGIDAHGRLLVDTPDGRQALNAGEVHLGAMSESAARARARLMLRTRRGPRSRRVGCTQPVRAHVRIDEHVVDLRVTQDRCERMAI